MASKPRSMLATLVGWVIVIIVGWWLLGFVIGTVRWLLRTVLMAAVLIGLVVLYLKLKEPNDPPGPPSARPSRR